MTKPQVESSLPVMANELREPVKTLIQLQYVLMFFFMWARLARRWNTVPVQCYGRESQLFSAPTSSCCVPTKWISCPDFVAKMPLRLVAPLHI
jgi:hypothetical protein